MKYEKNYRASSHQVYKRLYDSLVVPIMDNDCEVWVLNSMNLVRLFRTALGAYCLPAIYGELRWMTAYT
jgi:hypothetical protein